MYRKDSDKWIKHIDFIILDLICLQVSYILAYGLGGHGLNVYASGDYAKAALVLFFSDLLMIFYCNTMHDVLQRGYYEELIITIKNAVLVAFIFCFAIFAFKIGDSLSRLAVAATFAFYCLISYGTRLLLKRFLRKKKSKKHSLMILASDDQMEDAVDNIRKRGYSDYLLSGLAVFHAVDITSEDAAVKENIYRVGNSYKNIPIVADNHSIVDYVCQHWVDEILVVLSQDTPFPSKLMDELSETGVVVHFKLAKAEKIPGRKQIVEKVGSYTVMTTTINYVSNWELFLKRSLDILGGLVGCLLTGLICIFVAPAIYIASPGPIFYSQERIGLNGKRFRIYKFRSMYMDADKRKAELMKFNKITDPRMFKMDFDPRVIGNKILPDGTHKTGIGDFIRKTSLDEFPQFFNVLKGDMSLVGTRPPLPSETALYEPHHHVRLAVKPGITGMWQISGRSDITDFEEVVRLDKEYIENWSFGLDLKILLKTVLVVFGRKGSA